MNKILYDRVPSVDLNDFTSGNSISQQNFVQTLGDAFQNIGFVAVKNHGLSEALTESLYQSVKQFFALPEATKLAYEIQKSGGTKRIYC